MTAQRKPASRGPRTHARRQASRLTSGSLRRLWWVARRENLPGLAAASLAVTLIYAALCFAFEYGRNPQFESVWDAVWWAFVTMMTVGYGDKYPVTWPGRIVAICLMIFGLVVATFVTAAVAAMLVERRMREDKGLGLINMASHFVVCGWNQNAEHIIQELAQRSGKSELNLVLVNDMDEEAVSELNFKYPDAGLRFVKGDFTQESVLKRANVAQALAVLILADAGKAASPGVADQRTIIATLAVKTVAPDVTTCAELLDPANREHLERAKVDSVIVSGEHSGFLLANAATAPGVPAAVRELLSGDSGHALTQAPIPSEFVGRTFRELLDHFRRKQSALVLGLIREKKAITLDDILSSDYSSIDVFIRQKFEEAERDYFGQGRKSGVSVQLNPPDDYVVRDDEAALVITG